MLPPLSATPKILPGPFCFEPCRLCRSHLCQVLLRKQSPPQKKNKGHKFQRSSPFQKIAMTRYDMYITNMKPLNLKLGKTWPWSWRGALKPSDSENYQLSFIEEIAALDILDELLRLARKEPVFSTQPSPKL